MKRHAAPSVVVLAAGIAGAQTVTFTWHSDYDGGFIGLGETIDVWCVAEWDPDPGFGFASSLFDVVGDDDSYAQELNHDETQGLGRYFRFAGTFDGVTTGDDIIGIDEFQLPGAFGGGDPTNPIGSHDHPDWQRPFYRFEYTLTDSTVRVVEYGSVHHNADVYTDSFGSSVGYDVEVVPTFFYNIPSPGSVVLLTIGAVRRRRG
jgi:hypothetical protein